uniref:Uncharacterized protein n=1 Tax=Cacopsylla melanoneura TaxID=428564 RepID=A0A8D9FCR7_9HEMI
MYILCCIRCLCPSYYFIHAFLFLCVFCCNYTSSVPCCVDFAPPLFCLCLFNPTVCVFAVASSVLFVWAGIIFSPLLYLLHLFNPPLGVPKTSLYCFSRKDGVSCCQSVHTKGWPNLSWLKFVFGQ